MPEIDKFERLYEDMYIGRDQDNPPIVTRIAVLEVNEETICERLTKIEKQQDKMLWLSITTLIAVLIELLVKGH